MVDILFFAAIAFYIFLKLNKSLGNIDEDEKKKIQEKIELRRKEISKVQNQISEKIQEAVKKSEKEVSDQEQAILALDEKIQAPLRKILDKCDISLEFFLNGSKSAFEMVLKAFASSDLKALKFLLSDKLYKGFAASIKERQEKDHNLTTNVIAIDEAEITSAKLVANNAIICVKFVSKQINYISDKDGKIIDGAKEDIATLTDIWTFRKDVKSKNPNWVVTSTNN